MKFLKKSLFNENDFLLALSVALESGSDIRDFLKEYSKDVPSLKKPFNNVSRLLGRYSIVEALYKEGLISKKTKQVLSLAERSGDLKQMLRTYVKTQEKIADLRNSVNQLTFLPKGEFFIAFLMGYGFLRFSGIEEMSKEVGVHFSLFYHYLSQAWFALLFSVLLFLTVFKFLPKLFQFLPFATIKKLYLYPKLSEMFLNGAILFRSGLSMVEVISWMLPQLPITVRRRFKKFRDFYVTHEDTAFKSIRPIFPASMYLILKTYIRVKNNPAEAFDTLGNQLFKEFEDTIKRAEVLILFGSYIMVMLVLIIFIKPLVVFLMKIIQTASF